MQPYVRLFVVASLVCIPASHAQDEVSAPSKPRVLLIGDSISAGYTRPVTVLLKGVAAVSRVKGNAGDTARGLQRIESWLAAGGGRWDVIHFNWGLWDLCYRSPSSKAQGRRDKRKGKLTATIPQYVKNLKKLCARLEKTGAHLIFATTTPVPPGEVGRKQGDSVHYNAAATKLMQDRGIAVNDLHATIGDRMSKLAKGPGDVHFKAEGNQVLASQVAKSIRRALRQRLAGKQPAGSKPPAWQPTRSIVYSKIGAVSLRLHLFQPDFHRKSDRRAAIVFFFGGGWNSGDPKQFFPHCEYLASRGMLAFSAEYRVRSRYKTTPYESVADGKTAIRWVREHATELGVDPSRIAAGGGSAGGHVAAATALSPGLPEAGQRDPAGSLPNALVLFNPVYDNGPTGYAHERVGERWRLISPMHNIDKAAPPSICFLGTKDSLVPVATGRQFRRRMKDVSVRSELVLFEGRAHGFFNHGRGKGEDYRGSVAAMDRFLTSLGFLQGAPFRVR